LKALSVGKVTRESTDPLLLQSHSLYYCDLATITTTTTTSTGKAVFLSLQLRFPKEEAEEMKAAVSGATGTKSP